MYVRPYQLSDKPACLALFQSNMPLFFAPHEYGQFEHFLDYVNEPYLVLIDASGALIACGGYWQDPESRIVGLSWGMVQRERHRRGIGWLLLLARLQEIYRHYGPVIVRLDTSQHSAGFFGKAGFVVDTITEDAYAPGLHRIDMHLELTLQQYDRLSALLPIPKMPCTVEVPADNTV